MAPNPIACSHRLYIPYTVSGLNHVTTLFVHAQSDGEGGYELVHYGNPNKPWQDDADRWNLYMSDLYNTAVTFGDIILQQYAAGEYIPVATHTPGETNGTSVAATFPASQLTIVGRDNAFRKLRINLQETIIGNPFHYVVPTTPTAALNSLLSGLVNPTDDNDPGFWIRSRSEYVWGSFISVTATDNRHTRRNRGLI